MVAVTVGLPFFDAQDSLAAAIRSVFAQTFADWELLLVDDGSRDRSLDIARRVADPRVRVLSDGKNRRLPARLNQIADAARGEFVARLDADDLMHPERLAREVRALRERPSSDLVGTACFALSDRCRVVGVLGTDPVCTNPYRVLRRGLLAHATILCRTQWCRSNRYDERYPRAEDRELFCRTLGRARFEHIRDPLYFIGSRKSTTAVLRDYIQTSRDNRRLFAQHAPRLVGSLFLPPLFMESIAKEAIFRGATALGLQRMLVHSRGRPASAEEVLEGDRALRWIRDTGVRGLD